MDQDSFRRLLQTPGASKTLKASSVSRRPLPTPKPDDAQVAFKPRKVKKPTDSKYRNRAAERRGGEVNDYAQVEAVLEDFEKQIADSEDKAAVEEKRRYLGGDGDHSILVKGLDIALLEQNKARAALSTGDDDSLEQAFLEITSGPTVPTKRTREDLIRELKEKRAETQTGNASEPVQTPKTAEEEIQLLEEAKKKGKFKPIGLKPPEEAERDLKKRAKGEGKDGERRKKRRKVKAEGTISEDNRVTDKDAQEKIPLKAGPTDATGPSMAESPPPVQAPTDPDPLLGDFDIFAGAGEYEGLDLGDDDEGEEGETRMEEGPELREDEESSSAHAPRRWIPTDGPETLLAKPELPTSKLERRSPLTGSVEGKAEQDEEWEIDERVLRLAPLASSALPSIKDFLAVEEASGASGKRGKRKEKRKAPKDNDDAKKRTAEAKADRDYKRLKSYTDKKGGG